jgi:hypothetical protein
MTDDPGREGQPQDSVSVATGGTIDRPERCDRCGKPMIFRVDVAGAPYAMFCGDQQCPAWLRESAISGPAQPHPEAEARTVLDEAADVPPEMWDKLTNLGPEAEALAMELSDAVDATGNHSEAMRPILSAFLHQHNAAKDAALRIADNEAAGQHARAEHFEREAAALRERGDKLAEALDSVETSLTAVAAHVTQPSMAHDARQVLATLHAALSAWRASRGGQG